MSDQSTKKLIAAYYEDTPATSFFTSMFRPSFFNSEEIEIDIERCEEDVAIVITDLSTGYRSNSTDLYTNKAFIPPIYKESVPINAFDLLKRYPGQNPFEMPDFRFNLINRVFSGFRKIERKIRRSIELQGSQILQTGTLTLTDENGTALYTVDFKPKATHFPTAGTDWNQATSTPLSDINALAEIIRNDGKEDPDELIMGVDAFTDFQNHADVKDLFDNRRYDVASLLPMEQQRNGGTYRGTIEIGNYSYRIWSYGGRYKKPDTGVVTQYLSPEKAILKSSMSRLDACYGAIPNFNNLISTGNRILEELPGRASNSDSNIDLFMNAWTSPDGEQLMCGCGSRPMLIPSAIDTFGCIDTSGP